jgi:hypothetical protein
VSLFTLWPFLWIWAVTYRPDRGWGFAPQHFDGGHRPGGRRRSDGEPKRVGFPTLPSSSATRRRKSIRLDMAAGSDELWSKLQAAPDWDLIVCDEAHRMAASYFGGEVKETQRYKLGKLLKIEHW